MSATTGPRYPDIVIPPSPSTSDSALSSSSSSDLSDLEDANSSSVSGDADDRHSEDEDEDEDDGASSLSELSDSSDNESLSDDDDLSSPPDTPVKRPRGRPSNNRSAEGARLSTSSARLKAFSSPTVGSRISRRTHGLPPEANALISQERAASQTESPSVRRTRSGHTISGSAQPSSKSSRMSTRRSSASASSHANTNQTPRKRSRPAKHPRPLPTPTTPSTSSSFLDVSIGPSSIVKSDFSPGGDPRDYAQERAPKRRRTLSSNAPLTPGDSSVDVSSSTTKKRRKVKNRGWGRTGTAKAPKTASDPSAPPRVARKRLHKPDPTLDYLSEVFSLNDSNGEGFQYNGDALSVPFPFTFDPDASTFQPDDKGKGKEGDISASYTILEMPLEGPVSVLEASHKEPLPIPSSWIPPPPPQAIRHLERLQKRKQREERRQMAEAEAEKEAMAQETEDQKASEPSHSRIEATKEDEINASSAQEVPISALDVLASAGSARRMDEHVMAAEQHTKSSNLETGEGSIAAPAATNTSEEAEDTQTPAVGANFTAPVPLTSEESAPIPKSAPHTAAPAAKEATLANSSIAGQALLSALPKLGGSLNLQDIDLREHAEDDEDDRSDTESDDGITPLRPSSFYPTPGGSGGFPGIPIFTPTMSQFRDFYSMCKRIDAWGMRTGIVKIIPPKEWTDALPHLNMEEALQMGGPEMDEHDKGDAADEAHDDAAVKQREGPEADAALGLSTDIKSEGNASAEASAASASKTITNGPSSEPPVPPLRTIRIRNAIRQLILPVGSGAYSQTNLTTPNKVWNVKQWADICASEGQRGPELERMKRKIESLKAGADALNVHGLSGYRRKKRTGGAAGEDDDAVEDLEEMLKETEGVRTRSGRKHRTARDEEADDEEEEEDEEHDEKRRGAAPAFRKQPGAIAPSASNSPARGTLSARHSTTAIATHSPPRSEHGVPSPEKAMHLDDIHAGTPILTPPASHANDGSDRSDHQVGSPPATGTGASSTDSALAQTIGMATTTTTSTGHDAVGPSEEARGSGDSPSKPAKKVSMPDRTTLAEWQAFDYQKCWLREAMDLEDQPALTHDGGEGGEASGSASKALPSATEWTIDVCREIEGEYWRNLSMGKPAMYGADLPGTLFKPGMKVWNVGMLDNLLTRMRFRRKLRGVTTPYLYFGMWRATFAWHLEDMDLYSINYIHFGAPKQWYAIPQTERKRFETALASAFPADARKCPHFMRHKSYLVSPRYLARHNIKPLKLVQHAGEFVITYPYGYHSGFNLGFNCAESVNFALDTWVEIGRNAGFCKCRTDSVQMDVEGLMEGAMEEEAAREKKEAEDAEKKEKARLKKLSAAAGKKASGSGGKRKAADEEGGTALDGPKSKKSKKEDGPSLAPGEEEEAAVLAAKASAKPKGYPCVFCVSMIEDDMVPVPRSDTSPSTSPKFDQSPSDAIADASVSSLAPSSNGKAKAPQTLRYAHRLCANVLPETWVHRDVEMVKKRRYVKRTKPVDFYPLLPQPMVPQSQAYPTAQGYPMPQHAHPGQYAYPTPSWQPYPVPQPTAAAAAATQPRSAFAPHREMYGPAHGPHPSASPAGHLVPAPAVHMYPGYAPQQQGHIGAAMPPHDPTSVRERWAHASAPYLSGYPPAAAAAAAAASGYHLAHRRSPAAPAAARTSVSDVVPMSDDEDTRPMPPAFSKDNAAAAAATAARMIAVPSSDPGDEEAPMLVDEDDGKELAARRMDGEYEEVVEEEEVVKSEEVRGFENIERARWNLKCSLCPTHHLAKQGCKVQCTRAKCSRAAHVTCANLADSGWYVAILKKAEADRLEYGGIHTKKRSKGAKSKAKPKVAAGDAADSGAAAVLAATCGETEGASTSATVPDADHADAGDVSMAVDRDGGGGGGAVVGTTGKDETAVDADHFVEASDPVIPERDELGAEERLVLLCRGHNPEVKKQEAIRRALALRAQCLNLEPMTLINVRAGSNSGVWQVLLLEVIDVPGGEAAVQAGSPPTTKGEVVVMYDGQQHRIKWGRIEFGNGSTMKGSTAPAPVGPVLADGAVEPGSAPPPVMSSVHQPATAVASQPASYGAPVPSRMSYGAAPSLTSNHVGGGGAPFSSPFAPPPPTVYHPAPIDHHIHNNGAIMPHGPGRA